MGTTFETGPEGETITVRESDGWFVARDEETGVSSQGETKPEALVKLAEALALHHEPVPEGFDDDLESSDAPWL